MARGTADRDDVRQPTRDRRATVDSRDPADALGLLAATVAAEGPPLAVVKQNRPRGRPSACSASAGPRTASHGGAYAFVVEAVREGYLCHYETSRVLESPDPDLALLAGDLFYAIGISALAELGDDESVRLLSDLIVVSAELRSSGRRDHAEVVLDRPDFGSGMRF